MQAFTFESKLKGQCQTDIEPPTDTDLESIFSVPELLIEMNLLTRVYTVQKLEMFLVTWTAALK